MGLWMWWLNTFIWQHHFLCMISLCNSTYLHTPKHNTSIIISYCLENLLRFWAELWGRRTGLKLQRRKEWPVLKIPACRCPGSDRYSSNAEEMLVQSQPSCFLSILTSVQENMLPTCCNAWWVGGLMSHFQRFNSPHISYLSNINVNTQPIGLI